MCVCVCMCVCGVCVCSYMCIDLYMRVALFAWTIHTQINILSKRYIHKLIFYQNDTSPAHRHLFGDVVQWQDQLQTVEKVLCSSIPDGPNTFRDLFHGYSWLVHWLRVGSWARWPGFSLPCRITYDFIMCTEIINSFFLLLLLLFFK